MRLSELQQVILNGIAQEYNETQFVQHPTLPTLLFWLKRHKEIKLSPKTPKYEDYTTYAR